MFGFNDQLKMVRTVVRKWAQDKLEPKVDDLEAGEPPYGLMRDLAKTFGIASMVRDRFKRMAERAAAGEGHEGDEAGRRRSDDSQAAMSAAMSIEISRVCPGFMLSMGASMGLAGGAIMGKGTLEQKQRWALPLLTIEKIGAWAMTEPGAGSDAFGSMRTVAVPKDGGYLLRGQKTFITNAPYADVMVVYAKIDHGDGIPLAERPIQAFVVERGDAGVAVSKPMEKMGMHSSPTGEIFLDDCFVPADRLLGMKERELQGRSSGKSVFHSERTGMAPMCIGIIDRCLEASLAFAEERVTWGKRIAEYQLVQEKLARMFMHLQNCENLMFKELALVAEGKTMSPAEASASKLYCGRAATECALEAVQIMGGYGYIKEYRVEMLARDAKLLQIGGGTDEIQIINIARHLRAGAR